MQEEVRILKVRFNKITLKQATNTVLEWVNQTKQHYITTPNPEFLLEASKNHKFRLIVNNSDLNIPDGIGILWASRYQHEVRNTKSQLLKITKAVSSLFLTIFHPKYIKKILPERVTGTDLMQEICKEGQNTDLKVFLLGAGEGIADKTKKKLIQKYPNLNIVGTYAGSPKTEDEKFIIDKINDSKANVLFVAFGAPKQEIWISKNLKKLNAVKVAMGIGGAFDFIAGEKKRAPKIMQRLGLEWFFRLIQEPKRIKRIINATIIFPLKVIRGK